MKVEVINLKTYNIEVKLNDNFSVTIKFYGERKNSRTDSRTEINITFSWYMLRFFKSQFNKIAGQAQKRIDDSGFSGRVE